MAKFNFKRALKRIGIIMLTAMMAINVMHITPNAATNDLEYNLEMTQDRSRWSDHDVTIDGDPYTVYCLQQRYLWPYYTENDGTTSMFAKADLENFLLTPEQTNMMRKLLYAGYPYNGIGLFNDVYKLGSADIINTLCAEAIVYITQSAVWELTSTWGLPGNETYTPNMADHYNDVLFDFIDEYGPTMWDYISAMVNFATDETTDIPELATDTKLTFSGDATLKQQNDGTWMAGPLSVNDPQGFKLLYTLTASEGLSIVDGDGQPFWGRLTTDDMFYIVCDDAEKLSKDAKINAATIYEYPAEVSHFLTTSTRQGSSKDNDGNLIAKEEWLVPGNPGKANYPVQTMLACSINTTALNASLNVDVESNKTGALAIEKKLADEDAVNEAANTTFNFQVTLTGDEKYKINDTEYTLVVSDIDENGFINTNDAVSTNVKATNGVINFAIAGNQLAVIEGIACGVEYKVTELFSQTTANNWSADTNDVTGTISEDEINRVEITNSYTYAPVTSAPLTGTKNLTGAGAPSIENGKFSFILTPEKEHNPMPAGAIEDEHGWPVLVVSNGTPTDPKAIEFGSFTFDKPGVYVYTIQEEDVTVANTSRDKSEYVVTYTVTSNNGVLDINSTISSDNQSSEVVFNNEYTQGEVDQDFTAVKRIEDLINEDNNHSLAGYRFEIKPVENSNIEYPKFGNTDSSSAIMVSDQHGIANSDEIVFTEEWFNNHVSAGETSITLDYTITELASDVAGIVNDEDSVRNAKVVVTKSINENNVVELTSVVSYKDSTGNWSHEEPEFVNRYTVEPVSAFLTVNKLFSGAPYTPAENEKYQFTVTPYADYGSDVTYSDVELSYQLTENGGHFNSNESGKLTFAKPGVYEFEITEVDPQINNMGVDSLLWGVRVHVKDNGNGTMSVDSIVYNQQDSLDTNTVAATFTNSYETSTTVSFEVSKEVIGGEWLNIDVFDFTVDVAFDNQDNPDFNPLTASQMQAPVAMHNNISIGNPTDNKASATFEATINAAGTYYFLINEVAGNNPAMSYDDSTYVVKFVVEQQGNALAVSDPDYSVVKDNDWSSKDSANGVNFTNYESSLEIVKSLDDNANVITADATFDIELSVGDHANHLATATIGENKQSIVFEDGKHVFTVKANEVIKISGLPIGTEYTVTELLSEEQQNLFSTSVTVLDNEDNKVASSETTTVSATLGAKETHYVTVKNVVNTTSLVIKKIVVDETETVDLANEKYEFTVTVEGLNGDYVGKLSDGSEVTVTFTDGKATIKLAHNQSLEINNLPVNAKYTVSENVSDEYEVEITFVTDTTVTVEAITASGTLASDAVDTITFTNTLTKQDEEPGDDEPGDDEPGDDEPGDDEPGDDEPGDDEPGTDEPGSDEPGSDEPNDDGSTDVYTGDNTPIIALGAAWIVSVIGLITLWVTRKKKN